ncbi:4Fe-4S dicluster domain-containing protein [Streptomyces beihaiensis]|uniref:4Fe-4S dicluster domain-containing protein n=1 Tax=Streptomyces beihaiensis TaxID=2984495 RepID=A0ABT3TSC9_9ACTN|nr:4Fe-4S dicluster domain-containing protein [Streptomyces beihaiensis]MCX3059949.1 4Fe-4S dicluster domain-containing protein [Streptomyces beihaiensis]
MTDRDTTTAVIGKDGVDALISVLAGRGRTVVGPTVRDGAIVLAELTRGDELPYGWGVELEAGHYRLRAREDGAAFANSAGPNSWKTFLHPQRERQWTAERRTGSGDDTDTDSREAWVVVPDETPSRSYAFLGVRPCDLRAIAIQDRVLTGGPYADRAYRGRRERAFLVVVECTEPGATCFCVSMGAGPGVDGGSDASYDLALTEVVDAAGHRFHVRAGSAEGAAVLAELPHRPADDTTAAAARERVAAAAGRMGRTMPEVDLRALMRDSLGAERWNDVAARCLTCGNCTMVCPTCFCTSAEDVTDLTGDHTERWRRWESCFDLEFTHLPGGTVRSSSSSRYRQWCTHKLGTWHDQFGSSGCVGCGRCVVWCPVGIDITEEAHALADERAAGEGGTS